MDFTWPMNDQREGQLADTGAASKGSALDFVMNAWALLRGNVGDDVSSKGAATIARASLEAAGGESVEADVNFVKKTWALFQQAMEEGWVTEWIETFTLQDVVIVDSVCGATPRTVRGQAELAQYYNSVLDKVWSGGSDTNDVSLTWKPRQFTSMGQGSGVVLAEYDIEVRPKQLPHSRQMWIYHIEGERIASMRMFPLASDCCMSRDHKTAPVHEFHRQAHQTPQPQPYANSFATPSMCQPYAFHDYQPQPHPTQPTPQQCEPAPAPHQGISDNASVAESMPSLCNGANAVGVSLTRPCAHNSWDNVRIKRGWAILRCRICQSQWRLRPTAIPHCPEFARGAGCCPRGTECAQLHVHRTRESTEGKKAAAMPPRTGSTDVLAPVKTVTHQNNPLHSQAQAQAQKFVDFTAQPQCQNGPPQSALSTHTPYPEQHQPYAM